MPAPTTPGTITASAAFTGFESSVIYRREAKNPDRTIPRATYIAVAFLGLFYAFVVWTVIQAFGEDKVVRAAADDPGGLFFAAITTYVGAWAADLMHLLIITSVLASLLAFHNAINRYALSLSEEGVLPKTLGRIHPATAPRTSPEPPRPHSAPSSSSPGPTRTSSSCSG